MDEDRVLARLDRIVALDRGGAAPGEVLAELRGLIRDAETVAPTPSVPDPTTEEKEVESALARRVHGT
jgi:hypothetical protein